MAMLRIAYSDIDRATYERLVDELEIATDHPLGLIMHGAAEVDGNVAIAQVWDSAEYAKAFGDTRLASTLARLGIAPAREAVVFELTDLITP